MKLTTIEQIKKLKESGPRKKDREFWDISRKDINQSNYNIWLCWMQGLIEYMGKRAERSVKVKNSASVNSENSEA